MPNEEDRKWLYGQFKDNGYDTGSYDDFVKSLDNDEDFEWWHKEATSLGLEVGDLAEFGTLFRTPKDAASAVSETASEDNAPLSFDDEPNLDALNERARKSAEKEQKKAEKEAEKAARDAQKAEERAKKEAEKAARDANEARRKMTPQERTKAFNARFVEREKAYAEAHPEEVAAENEAKRKEYAEIRAEKERASEDVQRFGTGNGNYSFEEAVSAGEQFAEIAPEIEGIDKRLSDFNARYGDLEQKIADYNAGKIQLTPDEFKQMQSEYGQYKKESEGLSLLAQKYDEVLNSAPGREYKETSERLTELANGPRTPESILEYGNEYAKLQRNPIYRASLGENAPSEDEIQADALQNNIAYYEEKMKTAKGDEKKALKKAFSDAKEALYANPWYKKQTEAKISENQAENERIGQLRSERAAQVRENLIERNFTSKGKTPTAYDQSFFWQYEKGDPELQRLDAAAHMHDDAIREYRNPTKYDESKGLRNVGKGFAGWASDTDTWSFGIEGFVEDIAVVRPVLEKVQSIVGNLKEDEVVTEGNIKALEEQLTPGELAVLDAYFEKVGAVSAKGADTSIGYQIGQGIGDMVTLGLEMIATGGAGGVARTATEKGLKKGLVKLLGKRAYRKAAQSGAGKVALWAASKIPADMVETAVRIPFMPSTYKALGEGSVQLDSDYKVRPLSEYAPEKMWDQYVEQLTEVSNGFAFPLIGKVVKTPGMQKMMKGVLGENGTRALRTFMERGDIKLLDDAMLGSFGGEWEEELLGAVIHSVTDDPNAMRDFFSAEQQLVLLGTLAPLPISRGLAGGVPMAYTTAKADIAWNRAQKELERAGFDEGRISRLKEVLDNAPVTEAAREAMETYADAFDGEWSGLRRVEIENPAVAGTIDAAGIDRFGGRADRHGSLYDKLAHYFWAAQQKRALGLMAEIEQDRKIEAKRNELEQRYGGVFYHQDIVGGSSIDVIDHATMNGADGNPVDVLITSENPNFNNEYAYVSEDGGRGFVNGMDVTFRGVVPLDEYLAGLVMEDAQTAQVQGMVNEAVQGNRSLRDQVEALPEITYNGQKGSLIRAAEDGAVFVPEDGEADNIPLTWAELAEANGIEVPEVPTDAERDDAAAAEIAARYQAQQDIADNFNGVLNSTFNEAVVDTDEGPANVIDIISDTIDPDAGTAQFTVQLPDGRRSVTMSIPIEPVLAQLRGDVEAREEDEEPAPESEPEEAPAETTAEEPAEEAPKIPVDKNGNPIYDAPGVSVEDALADMYSTEGLEEPDVDEYIINRAKEAEKGRAVKQGKMSLKEWGAAKKEANRIADFWGELKKFAEENKAEREKQEKEEAARKALIEKYGVDTSKFDLTPQTAEEAVAEYLGNSEKLINLEDAIRETLGRRKDNRVPTELFRHLGAHGILTKNGGLAVADAARDVVGEYGDTVAVEEDEARDLIINMLLGKTKSEIRDTIFNNRLEQARQEQDMFQNEEPEPEPAPAPAPEPEPEPEPASEPEPEPEEEEEAPEDLPEDLPAAEPDASPAQEPREEEPEENEEEEPAPAPAPVRVPKQEIKLRPGDILLKDMSDVIEPWIIERLEGVGFNTGMEVLEADLGAVSLDTDIDMDEMAEIYDIIRRRLNGEKKDAPQTKKKEEKPSESSEKSVTSQKEEKAAEPAPAAPQELTEEQIRNSGYPDEDVIDAAVDYVNGDKSFANTAAYKLIKDYVGSQRTTAEQTGGNADGTQLDGPVVPAPGAGAEPGGRQGGPMGRSEQEGPAERVPGDSDGGVPSGEGRTASATGEGLPADAKGARGDDGGRRAGSREPGRPHDDGGRQGQTAPQPQPAPRGEIEAGSTDIDALGGELEDLLKQFGSTSMSVDRERRGLDEMSYSEVPEEETKEEGILSRKLTKKATIPLSLEGLSPKQAELAGKIIFSSAKLGYAFAKTEGMTTFNDFRRWFKSKFGDAVMKGLNYDESTLDAFINEVWKTKMRIGEKRLTLEQHASELHNAEVRKDAEKTIPERIALQKEANERKEKPVPGSRKSISETVPILTSGQWDDLVAIERQFFDPSHNDYDHAYGKGMLITNGTGTGKTFTGLGTIKRFLDMGKKRILLVSPANMVGEWTEKAKLLGIDMKRLEDTKDKGEGVVATSYQNFWDNTALYEDEFDLVVYDECQYIIYNQEGEGKKAYTAHKRITNKNVDEASERIVLGTTEPGRRKLELLKETEKLAREQKDPATTEDRQAEIVIRNEEIENEIEALDSQIRLLKPKYRELAEASVKRTKTLFLSATPFHTIQNLRYAEGYIFQTPKVYKADKTEVTDEESRWSAFITEWFRGDEPIEELEYQFGDHLLDDLETASFRELENGYDHSRDFPDVSGNVMAARFNAAWQAILKDPRFNGLKEAAEKILKDRTWTTQLFETMKVSAMRDRLKEHLEAGRKIVIFHDRMHESATGGANGLPPVGPPFAAVLDYALRQKGPSPIAAIASFRAAFADILEWEQTLDYRPVHEQVIDFYATDADRAEHAKKMAEYEKKMEDWRKECDEFERKHPNMKPELLAKKLPKPPKRPALKAESVVTYNGEMTPNEKEKAKAAFNSDESKVKIICVTTASGGAGLSLHDTTGKFPRVLIQTALPNSPIGFIQAEGRIFRWGNRSNAVFEYPRLGINLEAWVFAQTFNAKAETVENLAHGFRGRGLKDSIMTGFYENSGNVPIDGQGIGGVEMDKRGNTLKGMAKAKHDFGVAQRKGIRDNDHSVPEPVGFKMTEWAKCESGDAMLVPFAGRGSIARYSPKGVAVTALEQDTALQADLMVTSGGGDFKLREGSFAELGRINKYDVVMLNGDSDPGMNACETMRKGFLHLSEGGRLIAVVPDNSEAEFTIKDLSANGGVLRASIKVGNPAIGKGEGRSRIVVIDKITKADLRKKAGAPIDEDLSVAKQEDLFNLIENIQAPARIVDKQAIAIKKIKSVLTEMRKNKLMGDISVMDEENAKARISFSMADRLPKGLSQSKYRFDALGESGWYYTGKWFSVRYASFADPQPHDELIRAYQWLKEVVEITDINEFRKKAGIESGAKEENIEAMRDLYRLYMRFIRAGYGLTETQIQRVSQGLRPDVSAADIDTLNSYDELRAKFEVTNHDDEERLELYSKVAKVGEKIGLKIGAQAMDRDFLGGYNNVDNSLTINKIRWNGLSDEKRAQTLLHEFIHSVTVYAIAGYDTNASGMSDELFDAAKLASDVFEQVKKGAPEDVRPFTGQYAIENAKELLAEMANTEVKEKLQNRRMWVIRSSRGVRVSGAEMEGAELTDAWTLMNEALDGMLKNFDKGLFDRFKGRVSDFFWNVSRGGAYSRDADNGKADERNGDKLVYNAKAEEEADEDGALYRTSEEISEEYPNWMDDQTSTDVEGSQRGQNTQVAGTVGTYRKVGDWIERNVGKDARILDASSGLGLGTLELRGRGLDVDDIEPYPGKGRRVQPTYGGEDAYQKAIDDGEQYDFIISNAVLNVIPDDWRSGVLHDMARLLAPGGRMFINTRKAGEEKTIKNKIELDSPQEVLVGTPERINSYQRFFTPTELKEYIESELGDGYTVEIANRGNSGTSGLAAVIVTKKGESRLSRTAENLRNPIDRAAAIVKMGEIAKKLGVKFKEDPSLKAKGVFSPKTGEIRINIDAHKDTADLEATLLHEAVAHYGLRNLFKEDWPAVRKKFYEQATDGIKAKVDALAKQDGLSKEVAMEEYIASLAEDGRFGQEEETFWQKVVTAIKRMLQKIGFNTGRLTDEDFRAILYASFVKMRDGGPIESAAKIATYQALRKIAYASHDFNPDDDGPDGGGNTPSQTDDGDLNTPQYAEPFYSNAESALERIKMEKATPEQWLKMLEKEGGLKSGEDKWLGLSEWLKSQDKKSLTKQEIADFIAQNKIQIEETHYFEDGNTEDLDSIHPGISQAFYINRSIEGRPVISGVKDNNVAIEMYNREHEYKLNPDEILSEEDYDTLLEYGSDLLKDFRGDFQIINPTRATYTTSGLVNKREIVMTVPTIDPWNESDAIHFGDAGEGRAVAWARFGETTDAEGNRVLVIDEIQSKRHQEGREKGYKTTYEEREKALFEKFPEYKKVMKGRDRAIELKSKIERETGRHIYGLFKEDFEKYKSELYEYDELESAYHLYMKNHGNELQEYADSLDGRIPKAPFEKNWHELAMKRMLRLAAEEGYDYVAWTTGDQQAERYNLSSVVSKIELRPWGEDFDGRELNAGKDARAVHVWARQGDGAFYITNIITDRDGKIIDGEKQFVGENLSDVLGKELASRIVTSEGKDEIGVDELRIGGKGMKGFYDDIIPHFMNKYVKKWGAKVSDITLPNVEEAGRVMHAVPVTQEMKDAVMEGQAMFRNTEYPQEMKDIRTKALAEGSFMKAPNGQPTNLTEDQWLTVRTKAFKAWFGDWEKDPANASKVVDENGEPLVVYHGSGKEFSVFNTGGQSYYNPSAMEWEHSVGSFFTADREYAEKYAINWVGDNKESGSIYPVFLNLRKLYVADQSRGETLMRGDSFIDEKKEQGYDGIQGTDMGRSGDGNQEYIVFDPNQIKSATDNNGDFSNEDPDIYYRDLYDLPEDIRKDVEDLEVDQETEVLYRRASNSATAQTAAEMYGNKVRTIGSAVKEVLVDEMKPVDTLMEALATESGTKIKDDERVSDMMRETGGKAMQAIRQYDKKFLQPMWSAVGEFRKKTGESIKDTETYIGLKSGLERNVVLAKRDAKRDYQSEYDAEIDEINREEKTKKKALDKQLKNGKISDVTYSGELTLLQKEMQQKREDAALRLQGQFADVDAGTDKRFLEYRKKDYSAITAWAETEDLEEAERLAGDYVSDMESRAGAGTTKELWKRINAATKETLKFQYEHQILSRQQYQDISRMMEYYVPMRGFSEDTAEDLFNYYVTPQSNDFQATVLTAKGRKTWYEGPLGNIGAMHSSAVSQGVKNEAKLALLDAVRRRPKNTIATVTRAWFVKNGQKDANGKDQYDVAYPQIPEGATLAERESIIEKFEEDMAQKKAQGDAYNSHREVDLHGGVVAFERQAHKNEHIVQVREGGKEYGVIINGNPAAAQAINGVRRSNGAGEKLLGYMRSFTRVLSSMFTTFSVPFWVSNFQRDHGQGLTNAFIRNKPGYVGSYIANRIRAAKLFPLILGSETMDKALAKGDPVAKLYKQYLDNGGPMGQNRIEDNEYFERQMKRYLSNSAKQGVIKGATAVLNIIGGVGEAIETITRFAVFMTSMEYGRPIHESISDAKEISTNFARKGSGRSFSRDELDRMTHADGTKLKPIERGFVSALSVGVEICRATIPFFNAAVQGIENKVTNYRTHWGKTLIADTIYFMLGLGMKLLLGNAGGDDDKEKYSHTSDYLRRNNILNPMFGNGVYAKWALPQEYRVMYALGDIIASAFQKERPAEDLGMDVFGAIMQLSPIGAVTDEVAFSAENKKKAYETLITNASPGIVAPVLESIFNMDFKGARIYNEGFNENLHAYPGWTKALPTTGSEYVAVAKWLNEVTGGNDVERGWANINPAIVEHLVESYFSGPYQIVVRVPEAVAKIAKGEATVRDVPLLNRIILNTNDNQRDAYYNNMYYYFKEKNTEAERIHSEYKGRPKEGKVAEFYNSDLYKYMLIFNKYDKIEQELRKASKQMAEKGDLKKQKEYDERLQNIQYRIAKECLDLYFGRNGKEEVK